MKKKPEASEDVEISGNYYALYCKNREEAWRVVIEDYPEAVQSYTIDSFEEVIMYKCLDCNSMWVSDDVCGECGEFRLSKKQIPAYYLELK